MRAEVRLIWALTHHASSNTTLFCIAFLGYQAPDQQVSDPGQCNKPASHRDGEHEYPESNNQPLSEVLARWQVLVRWKKMPSKPTERRHDQANKERRAGVAGF